MFVQPCVVDGMLKSKGITHLLIKQLRQFSVCKVEHK